MSFCKAKTQSPKTAGMPFLGSARDRSGIFAKQKLERIARSPPEAGMRPEATPMLVGFFYYLLFYQFLC
jgi:hypothetical protein